MLIFATSEEKFQIVNVDAFSIFQARRPEVCVEEQESSFQVDDNVGFFLW